MRDDYFCEQSLRLGILPLERRTAKVLYIHLLLLINGMHGPMPGRSAMQTGRYQWVSVATISLQSVEDSEIPTYQLVRQVSQHGLPYEVLSVVQR